MHPPCRRKKLRPLRPRLAARTAFCSVPSSSPHAAGRAGAPVFSSRRKRDCARRRVSEANRREAAALRPETNGPCTVQKRKRSIRGSDGARLNDRRSRNDFPRAIGLSGGCSSPNGPAPLFAAAHLVVGGNCTPFSGSTLLSIDHRVGAAAHGGPSPRNLHAIHGPSPWAHPSLGRPPRRGGPMCPPFPEMLVPGWDWPCPLTKSSHCRSGSRSRSRPGATWRSSRRSRTPPGRTAISPR